MVKLWKLYSLLNKNAIFILSNIYNKIKLTMILLNNNIANRVIVTANEKNDKVDSNFYFKITNEQTLQEIVAAVSNISLAVSFEEFVVYCFKTSDLTDYTVSISTTNSKTIVVYGDLTIAANKTLTNRGNILIIDGTIVYETGATLVNTGTIATVSEIPTSVYSIDDTLIYFNLQFGYWKYEIMDRTNIISLETGRLLMVNDEPTVTAYVPDDNVKVYDPTK